MKNYEIWVEKIFKTKKPIIGLLHLRSLPGDPLFSEKDSMKKVIEIAKSELISLQNGGVDGILIANEFSFPYEKKVSYVTIAAMARIIGELKSILKIPFGVNIVSNPLATIDLAAATDAFFVRSTFTGAYIGENGIIDTNIPKVLRRKKYLGLDNLKLLYKVNPESDEYITSRNYDKIVKSIIFHCFPDGLCVSGSLAGNETDNSLLSKVKSLSSNTPVFCNTGCTKENIISKLKICDGACVGTYFKKDGKFENYVDENRVSEFMKVVQSYRNSL